jgi:hypothetical protein
VLRRHGAHQGALELLGCLGLCLCPCLDLRLDLGLEVGLELGLVTCLLQLQLQQLLLGLGLGVRLLLLSLLLLLLLLLHLLKRQNKPLFLSSIKRNIAEDFLDKYNTSLKFEQSVLIRIGTSLNHHKCSIKKPHHQNIIDGVEFLNFDFFY